MRILFLDDMKSRRDVFKQNAIGHIVDFAINAQQAIDFLKGENSYNAIYLDHDLEEDHYQSNEDHHKDGRFVARALRELKKHHGTIVIVHSLNPEGRLNIKSILDDCFDVWLPENVKISELWKVEASVLIGAIQKKNKEKEENGK